MPATISRHTVCITEPVSILLPVYNESEGIESVVAELVETVYRHLPTGSEFLIEESGSTDGTTEILQELTKRWPFITVSYRAQREGFAKATINLYQNASCPLLFFTDSDGQCVASEFWKLAHALCDNDMVLGVKRIRYDPLPRRLCSHGFNFLARRQFGFRYRDINFGFRLSRRELILSCLPHLKHMPVLINSEIAILAHCMGYHLTEVLVHHRPRIFGMSRGIDPQSLSRTAYQAFQGLRSLHDDFISQKLQRHAAEHDTIQSGR